MATRPGHRVLSAVAAGAIVVVYVVGLATSTWLERRSGGAMLAAPEQVAIATAFGWFALLAALLVWRQPRNPMGWLFTAITLIVVTSLLGPTYVELTLQRGATATTALMLLAWPNNWTWYLLLALMFIYVPLLFPDGRLLSPRWRPVAWLAGLATGAFCVLGALAGTITTQGLRVELPNPLGIGGLAHPEGTVLGGVLGAVGLVAGVGAIASLIVRFRRAHGQERLQVTWLLYASVLVSGVIVTEPLRAELVPPTLEELITGLSFNAVPLAITVAILRYRLYAIGRIVSRTLSYGSVTALVVATYALGVLLIGQVLSPLGTSQELAVAAATLAAAAVFRPALRRLRTSVDRRFDRSRYDTARTLEAFAQRLRDEVDLGALSDDLCDVVRHALRPSVVHLWVPRGDV